MLNQTAALLVAKEGDVQDVRNPDKSVDRVPLGHRTDIHQCYKLYTRRTESNSMPRFPVPEILRTPLESLFLQVKAMREEEDVKAFLLYVFPALHCSASLTLHRKAIDPPKMDAIEAAWKTLQDLGAVEGDDYTSKLTALGRHVCCLWCSIDPLTLDR